jgi:hypothetical protein
MQRVRQLYARYNVDGMRARRHASYVYCVISRKQRRISAEESMIFSVLTRHFFVRAIYLDHYDPQDLCSYKAVELMGTPENVLMSEYVYHFLHNQLRILWSDYKKLHKVAGRSRRSYMLGVLSGFSDKLAKSAAASVDGAESAAPTSEERALMRQADQQLEAFVQQRYPRITNRRTGGLRGDKATFNAGVSAGGNLNLHRGVTERRGNRGLLLGR